MRTKTAGEIKTSIKTFRGRRMACRTYQIEDEVVWDLENRYGEIIVPEREIDQILDRERKQAIRADAARKALLKTFQQRKKACMIQDLVEGRYHNTADENSGDHHDQRQTSVQDQNRRSSRDFGDRMVINEIEFEY